MGNLTTFTEKMLHDLATSHIDEIKSNAMLSIFLCKKSIWVLSGDKVVTFQNGLLVTAVLFTVLAVLSLLFWQEFWRDYGVILMLAAATAGVIGFTALDHEQEK